MMAAYPSQEHRPLKKPRLGAPDVYHQDPKQKEDELTATNVKQGFNNSLVISDEYGTARNLNISQEKFGAFFTAVMAKKTELNTCPDTGRKKQQLNKDNFWPAARSRPAMEAWFKDLAGSKPLSQLGKKVPLFPKKEEIFSTLCEFSIPVIKAAWFIKMTAAYNIALQENKTKKRQIVDQSVDWTVAITKFMKDQLQRVQEHYSGGSSSQQTSFLTASQAPSQLELGLSLKQWHYCCRLAKHMYEEGLLDRQDLLCWLVEQFVEKLGSSDDTVLKLILDQIVRNLDEFTLNQLLSRRLAYYCAKKLAQLCSESGSSSPRTQSPMLNANGTQSANGNNSNNNAPTAMAHNPVAMVFSEYNSCLQHRGVVLGLSAALQTITLKCPCAMVWNSLAETPGAKNNLLLCGSPLDLLPCAPSSLPMPPGPQNQQIRSQIRASEHQIKLRGRAAEIRWSSDQCQQSTTGFTISRILAVLDILDRHNFERVEQSSTLDALYTKIFPASQGKDNSAEPPIGDEPIINLLIDWAVSVHRYGNHRALVVAKLLDRRQSELRTEKFTDSEVLDEKESMGSEAMAATGLPPFQNLFIQFLDEKAPVLDDIPSAENKQAFANLIQLFCELIRNDVFSHDAYMCTLIARGDLMSSSPVVASLSDSFEPGSVKSEAVKQEVIPQDDIKMDIDLHNSLDISESYWSNLFDEGKDQAPKSSPEPPPSVKSVKSEKDPGPFLHSVAPLPEPPPPPPPKGPNRHLQYANHFPIPQDDASIHECNQRMVVLYGVGKTRDEAKHVSKKITKEILKLFSRKNCIDISSGAIGKEKKKKEKEGVAAVDSSTNLEATFVKFQKLSYYDQHAVTSTCAMTVLEQINTFMAATPSYLPLIDNVSYLFDLMEYSLNINGLMEFCIQLLRELVEVEGQLTARSSGLAGSYCPSLCMCVVALFRKYHTYLLVAQDWAVQAFESLISVVRHVSNTTDCSSAERCILAYLYDVYTACTYIKVKFSDMFSNAYTTINNRLCVPTQPSSTNLRWEPAFMIEVINSTRPQADAQSIRQLNELAANRYSFVCNAMLQICGSQGADRLNDISILCAEFTAKCNALSSEWLGVLRALCGSSNHSCGFIDVLTQIDVSDLSIHDSLAVFTSILIARHCFSLQDFVGQVALPSLMAACPSTGGDQDAESGARLTCHLLLHLFRTSPVTFVSPSYPGKAAHVRASCDRNLLSAAQASITAGAVLAVLKAMLVLGDSCGEEEGDNNSGNIFTVMRSLEDNPMGPTGGGSNGGMETAGLSEYAKHTLKEIRSQEWVREKFLKDPEGLFNQDMLLDTMLSPKQAQQLLQMLCYPNGVPSQVGDAEPDNRQVIQRILQTLDQWSLRLSLLELQLMFKQSTSQSETNNLLENIARGTIDLFQQQTEGRSTSARPSSPSIVTNEGENEDMWLVAPLISKLANGAQGRVLRLAGQVLESSNNLFLSSKGKMDREKNQKSKWLLSQQPFLSLVLTCLKGQDEQREGLLSSLGSQLEKFINNTKEILDKSPDEGKIRQNLHEALQLRLSLVGGMFDTIQRSNTLTSDWAIILLQLISYGVVDTQTSSELCTTVLDMLSVLILSTLVVEGEKGEDNKKAYSNLIKKLKKELVNKHTDTTDLIRQLLPLPQKSYEIITCEPHGTLVDTKGNKIAGFDSICKKQGHQVATKVRVSAWDVIEGYRNPAPLSWTYFGAVKLERKPLKYEEQFRMLLYHTHSLRQPNSYYLEAPPLPPEDLEPVQEKVVVQEEKPQEVQETQKDEIGKKAKRRRRPNRPSTSPYLQSTTSVRNMPEPMYQANPHPSWYSQQGQQYPFPQQPGPGPKAVLNTILRARQPPQSNFSQPSQQMQIVHSQMLKQQHRQQMIRQQLRARQQHSRLMSENSTAGMYGGGPAMAPVQPPGPYSSVAPNTPMAQGYPPYSNVPQQAATAPGIMEAGHSAMMAQPMSQQYPPSAAPMMPGMRQQQGYMPQQSQQQLQPPYNPQSRVHQAMGGNQPMSNMSGYSQMVQPAQQQHAASYNMQGMPIQQQQRFRQLQHQQQQQQQVLAMQQQQQQTQQHSQQQMQSQQQQTAALVAQLQRQMSSNQQPPAQPPPPQYQQHAAYQQHPQY